MPQTHVAGTLSAQASAQPLAAAPGGDTEWPLIPAPAGPAERVLTRIQRPAPHRQPAGPQDLLGVSKIPEAGAPGPAERTCLGRASAGTGLKAPRGLEAGPG